MIKDKINNKNQSIYTDEAIFYGLEVVGFNLLSILTILCIGVLSKQIMFSILFLISFIPMRLVIGGYHCKSIINCEISFSILYYFFQTINQYSFCKNFLIILFIIFLIVLLKNLGTEIYKLSIIRIILIGIYSLILIITIRNNYLFNIILSAIILNMFLKYIKICKLYHFS